MSTICQATFRRINKGYDGMEASMARSICVSMDMAHGVHPKYASKHEENMKPKFHKGLVLKHNCNQSYATNMATAFHMQELARRLEIGLQKFAVRQDMGCGSTIGAITAAKLGCRVVDVGIPQHSMHSIRESCGTKDVESTLRLMTEFYKEFPKIDSQIVSDE